MRRTTHAAKRCAWSRHPSCERRCIRFDQIDLLHAVSERGRRRNSLGERGLATCNSTAAPGGIGRLALVLGVDTFLQHQQRLASELRDATDRHPEEVGEHLRCSPFEERADHDQTVTIRQEADGVAQVTVLLAQLELGGRLDRVLSGEQVDQREILLALV